VNFQCQFVLNSYTCLLKCCDYFKTKTLNNVQVNVPGLEREITLGEMIELKLIDHTKTIVKSRRSNRYISTKDALKVGPWYNAVIR
jgi:hypothetical protein